MKIHVPWMVKDSLLSGLLFCLAIMLTARIHPLLYVNDLPLQTQRALKALPLPDAGVYEWTLLIVCVHGLLIWRAFRFLKRLPRPKFRGWRRLCYYYLHMAGWFFLLGMVDLFLLDIFFICLWKVPFLGVESILSGEAVFAMQSMEFHFHEHFMRMYTYVANLLVPMFFSTVYVWNLNKYN